MVVGCIYGFFRKKGLFWLLFVVYGVFVGMDRSSESLSFYNEGYFQIQRLNSLWVQANIRSLNGDLTGWRWVLDTIWRELSRDCLKQVDFKKGSRVWYQHNEFFVTFSLFRQKLSECGDDKAVRYQLLSEYDIFLRYLQDRVGKGGKYTDPDDNRMD